MNKSKLNEKLNKLQRTLLVYEEAGKHYRTEWRHGRCYKIYTHDKVTIEAEKKSTLFNKIKTVLWSIFAVLFITSLILLGLNTSESYAPLTSIWIAFGTIAGVNLVVFICASYSSYIEYCYSEIYKNFEYSKEYEEQLTIINAIEDILTEKRLRKKSEDLITVYDTLDDKELSKEEKIDILKDYMKEDLYDKSK